MMPLLKTAAAVPVVILLLCAKFAVGQSRKAGEFVAEVWKAGAQLR